MNPLEQYYLNQAGRGINSSSGIGPIYQVPTFVQRGHGIGDILGSLALRQTPAVDSCEISGQADTEDRWSDSHRHRK
jgi:hypothetical protein